MKTPGTGFRVEHLQVGAGGYGSPRLRTCIHVGAQYQFGGVPGSFSTGSTGSVSLAYAGGKYNLAGFITSANVDGYRNRAYSLGGNYLFGDVRVNGGVF